LFFGQVRDMVGRSQEELHLTGQPTLGDVFAHYAASRPALAAMSRSVLLSRNQEFARRDTPVTDGDEVALLPPVSGGAVDEIVDAASGNFFALVDGEIDSHAIIDRILRNEDGAVVDFLGVARNNSRGRATRYLDYECYRPMALKEIARIGRDIAARHAIGRIAIVHRLGRMLIGEASVAVVVTAPHRRVAFEAALEGIDRLKKSVPIWKKETFADGEVWVEGDWDDALRQTAAGK
jgi:molybdopterin synthase catalytic subunit